MHHVKLSDNGAVENIVSFNDDGEMVMRDVMSSARVEAVLDGNAHLRNHGIRNPKAHGRHAARIPITMWHEWRKEWKARHSDKWTWQTYLAGKLADPDYALLRTGVKEIGLSERNKTGATAPKLKPAVAHAQRIKANDHASGAS